MIPVVTLSSEYVVIVYNGVTYYYDQDSFYEDQGDQRGYVAVPPPMGIVVPTIRTTQYQHIVDGEIYYAHNGVYYQPVAGGYKVVGVVQD